MATRRAGRARAGQSQRNLASAQRKSQIEQELGLRRAIARGIQEFAVRSMNELAAQGPAWSGEFSQSWLFNVEGQTPASPAAGARREIGRYNKNDIPVRQVEKYLDSGISRFQIVNVAPHADIAIDQDKGIFKNDGSTPLKEPELGEGRDQPSYRWDIGPTFSGPEGQHSASRTAEQDWFQNYVQGGGLQKDLKTGFTYGFKEAGQ